MQFFLTSFSSLIFPKFSLFKLTIFPRNKVELCGGKTTRDYYLNFQKWLQLNDSAKIFGSWSVNFSQTNKESESTIFIFFWLPYKYNLHYAWKFGTFLGQVGLPTWLACDESSGASCWKMKLLYEVLGFVQNFSLSPKLLYALLMIRVTFFRLNKRYFTIEFSILPRWWIAVLGKPTYLSICNRYLMMFSWRKPGAPPKVENLRNSKNKAMKLTYTWSFPDVTILESWCCWCKSDLLFVFNRRCYSVLVFNPRTVTKRGVISITFSLHVFSDLLCRKYWMKSDRIATFYRFSIISTTWIRGDKAFAFYDKSVTRNM